MNKKINWTQLINDILKSDSNITFAFIAKKIGVNKSSVVRMRIYESEPKYSIGVALIALWREATKQQESHPPTLENRCKTTYKRG